MAGHLEQKVVLHSGSALDFAHVDDPAGYAQTRVSQILSHHLYWQHLVDRRLFVLDGLVVYHYWRSLFYSTRGKLIQTVISLAAVQTLYLTCLRRPFMCTFCRLWV